MPQILAVFEPPNNQPIRLNDRRKPFVRRCLRVAKISLRNRDSAAPWAGSFSSFALGGRRFGFRGCFGFRNERLELLGGRARRHYAGENKAIEDIRPVG